jgi:Fic family protein
MNAWEQLIDEIFPQPKAIPENAFTIRQFMAKNKLSYEQARRQLKHKIEAGILDKAPCSTGRQGNGVLKYWRKK